MENAICHLNKHMVYICLLRGIVFLHRTFFRMLFDKISNPESEKYWDWLDSCLWIGWFWARVLVEFFLSWSELSLFLCLWVQGQSVFVSLTLFNHFGLVSGCVPLAQVLGPKFVSFTGSGFWAGVSFFAGPVTLHIRIHKFIYPFFPWGCWRMNIKWIS